MPYMALPFILLAALIAGYLIYRNRKTGGVTFKVKHLLFNRVNLDLLLSALLVCALCALFLRSDLIKLNELLPAEASTADGRWIYGSRIIFYIVLVIGFLARQLERPALREKGISSARWFWTWDQVKSYRWNSNLLVFQIGYSKKQVTETWAVEPEQKQELDRLLRQRTRKRDKKVKNGKPAGR